MNKQTTNEIEDTLKSLNVLEENLGKITERINEDAKYNKVNVFDAVGMKTQEIKHSAFLKWLFNPKKQHGLSSTVLKMFLEHLIRHTFADDKFEKSRNTNATILKKIGFSSIADFEELIEDKEIEVNTEVVVYRDKNDKNGRIDIIIESKKANTVILIENKVFTGTHDNQLWRYEKGFEGSRHKIIYIYLTPFGNTPEDFGTYRGAWCVYSYQTVIQVARQVLKELPHTNENLRTRILIEDYIDIVNTEILQANKEIRNICKRILWENAEALAILKSFPENGDREIRERCKEIRRKNRKALDILDEYTDNVEDVMRYAWKYLNDNLERIEILRSSEKRFTFYTPAMSEFFSKRGSTIKIDDTHLKLYCNAEIDGGVLISVGLEKLKDAPQWDDNQLEIIKLFGSGKKLPSRFFTLDDYSVKLLEESEREVAFDQIKYKIEKRIQHYVSKLKELEKQLW